MSIRGSLLKAAFLSTAITGAVGYGVPAAVDAADNNGLKDAIPDSVRDFSDAAKVTTDNLEESIKKADREIQKFRHRHWESIIVLKR